MTGNRKSDDEFQIDDLTWRERDILNLLSERLSNREIAERLFLAESSVKDYVGKILKKLYVKNRRQAVERAKGLGLLGEDREDASTRKSNLPSSATPFIGRTGELEEIRQQLGKTRLLTLTGPGGMGKTRLALKMAEDSVNDFRDGCFFVSLAPIRSVDHIIQSISEAVNFPIPTHEDPKHQLLRYLRKKNLLLVMDNFEHLMDGAGIVSEILQVASGVKVLATSRERLNLKSETALNIAGMSETNNDAVALFLQSGAKAQPDFEPSSDELVQIENICQFVGGMPLAIELAASWLYVLSVGEITDELQKGLDILETEVRDAPERHRSIRAVFDQSWSLLDEKEQGIFMRLSIFRGGFTREAAREVTGASLKQIAGLVDKSIMRHDPNTGRLEIHELLRQYAQERLNDSPGANTSINEAYAAYYADLMQEKWEQLRGSRQIPALTEIEADIENVRAAWRYYLDEQNATQLKKFIYGLWIFYWIRGWVRGAIELFAEGVDALSHAEHDPDVRAVRAAMMAHHGFFKSWVGLADEGYKLAKESIKILERLDYPIGLAFAYNSTTMAAYYLNLPKEQRSASHKLLKFAESSNDQWLLAYALWFANFAEYQMKNIEESRKLADASLKASKEINNSFGLAWSYSTLGQRAIHRGDYAEAKNYYIRSLQTARKLKFDWCSSNAIKYLGEIALLTHDTAEAQEYFVQSLRTAYDLGLEREIANLLYDFSSLRTKQNRLVEAVELISVLLQQPASHLARLGGGRIRDRAKKLLAELESQIPRERYDAALRRGKLLNLDDVVNELIGPSLPKTQ